MGCINPRHLPQGGERMREERKGRGIVLVSKLSVFLDESQVDVIVFRVHDYMPNGLEPL